MVPGMCHSAEINAWHLLFKITLVVCHFFLYWSLKSSERHYHHHLHKSMTLFPVKTRQYIVNVKVMRKRSNIFI